MNFGRAIIGIGRAFAPATATAVGAAAVGLYLVARGFGMLRPTRVVDVAVGLLLLLLVLLGTWRGRGETLKRARAARSAKGDRDRLVDELAAGRAQERRSRRELEEALRLKEMLLYEVNHRVKNSLQLVTSMLAVEASRITDPEALNSLLAARKKIGFVAELHQRLYATGEHSRIDFEAFLRDMAAGVLTTGGLHSESGIDLTWRGDAMLSIRLAAPLSLAVNELVTNAVKYALLPRGATLRIAATRDSDRLELMVEDDGPGMPPDFDLARPAGLGLQIVNNLVRQLGGKLELEALSPGSRFTIRLPLRDES